MTPRVKVGSVTSPKIISAATKTSSPNKITFPSSHLNLLYRLLLDRI